jgi:hypothetical protein
MNITLEQRNAQKLYNLINVANQNVQNKDIYFFIKYAVKTMLNQIKITKQDHDAISNLINPFLRELSSSNWEIKNFDPKLYDKFLHDFYNKVNFNTIDTNFMFKCRDLLEISPVKNDLYKRRMEYFAKKLPKILIDNNNINNNYGNKNIFNAPSTTPQSHQPANPFAGTTVSTTSQQPVNPFNNTNIPTTNQQPINPFASNISSTSQQPLNPFEGITDSDNYGYGNSGPYSFNFNQPIAENVNNNNNGKNLLRASPPNVQNPTDMNLQNNKRKIPDDIKVKIIKELQLVSENILNGKIDDSRKHSVEAMILFKKVFPE